MKVEEKIRTHSLNSANLFSEKRSIYEIMWKDMVETDRPQMAIWRGAENSICVLDKEDTTTETH